MHPGPGHIGGAGRCHGSSILMHPLRASQKGALPPEIAAIAVPATTEERNMTGEDFALTAGWGHFGQGDAVMPGQGRVVERAYTPEERAAMGDAVPALGETTFDIHLNERAFWSNVPPPRGLDLQARRLPGSQEMVIL